MGSSDESHGSLAQTLSVSMAMIPSSDEHFDTRRDIAGVLANENENMRDHMRGTEKDTIEVVTFLKKQDVDKDAEVRSISLIESTC